MKSGSFRLAVQKHDKYPKNRVFILSHSFGFDCFPKHHSIRFSQQSTGTAASSQPLQQSQQTITGYRVNFKNYATTRTQTPNIKPKLSPNPKPHAPERHKKSTRRFDFKSNPHIALAIKIVRI